LFPHDTEQWGAIMSISSSHGGSPATPRVADDRAHELHQDRTGPLDGELLDLYVAILIVVPLACILRSLWF
jgi:hypothetical protein